MGIRANNPSIMDYKWGQDGAGSDFLGENGSVTFAGADTGDVYYNGAAVATMPLQTAAAAVELISDSAQDAAGGTGALTVRVSGLDGDYLWVTEDFTMTGAVAVVGTQLFLRILSMRVLTAGTGETNAGNIDCQAVGGGQVWDRIVADEGSNQHSLITVPAGKTFWVVHWEFTCNSLTAQTYRLMSRPYGGAWYVCGKRYGYFGGVVSHEVSFRESRGFAEKTDIKMNATVGGAGSVSTHMYGVLTDN